MRLVFMGTPEIAAACLKRLYEDGHDILAVYSKPDRPRDRGMKLQITPVKQFALEKGLRVIQPAAFKDEAVVTELRGLAPDLIVVVAYGKLLPKAVLHIPRLGCVNVHASLLPKYRGSAPVQWAVLNGEKTTGVTTMMMAETLDTGDIIDVLETPIGENETSGQLLTRLAGLGADLISKTVSDFEKGTVKTRPQNEAEATYAPMLTKDLSPIDWKKSAGEIHNQVRGLDPWPVATADFGGRRFKIYETGFTGQHTDLPPGVVVGGGKEGIAVSCGPGEVLLIKTLQAEGGKRMAAADYLRGHPHDFEA